MSTSEQKMNCETYKEAIAADPAFEDESGHVSACAACAEFRDEIRALDATIAKALSIDVPELVMPELPSMPAADEKVVSITERRKPRFSVPTWIGIAATVTLAAFIGLRYIPDNNISDAELADEILAHMSHEPWAMQVTDVPVTEQRLTDVMNANGGTMSSNVGLVSYAQTCIINGRSIPHLVIQGKDGPVTLLLMPEEMVTMPVKLDGRGVSGVILPVGDGSIALVGEKAFDVDELKERVVNSVEWEI